MGKMGERRLKNLVSDPKEREADEKEETEEEGGMKWRRMLFWPR
jgi:hypothetical protein